MLWVLSMLCAPVCHAGQAQPLGGGLCSGAAGHACHAGTAVLWHGMLHLLCVAWQHSMQRTERASFARERHPKTAPTHYPSPSPLQVYTSAQNTRTLIEKQMSKVGGAQGVWRSEGSGGAASALYSAPEHTGIACSTCPCPPAIGIFQHCAGALQLRTASSLHHAALLLSHATHILALAACRCCTSAPRPARRRC